jgi:hypothetical protein
MSILANFNYDDNTISQRADGFLNASQMCQANGKLLADWSRLKATKAYAEALSEAMGIPISQLIEIQHGNQTWIHPSLAINLARWISPKFAVWCDAHIFNLMTTGKTSLDVDPIDKLIKLEELRFKNTQLACDMATMHGKEYGALVLGRPDAVIEVDRPVLEVIDNRCGDRRRGMTFTQLNKYLEQKTGKGFKTGAIFQRLIEKERPDLVDLIQRPVNQPFVHEENIDDVIDIAMKQPRQLRIGD